MARAQVFKSGNRQAVRLPKQFRVTSKELEIERRGDEIILREPARGMEETFYLIAGLPKEVLGIRKKKDKPQKRRGLLKMETGRGKHVHK